MTRFASVRCAFTEHFNVEMLQGSTDKLTERLLNTKTPPEAMASGGVAIQNNGPGLFVLVLFLRFQVVGHNAHFNEQGL